MGVIAKVLLVVFIIVCVLLVLLVAIQDDGENGMGGLLGGRGTAAFGSHSASVLTKTTFVLVVLFFGLAGSSVVVSESILIFTFCLFITARLTAKPKNNTTSTKVVLVKTLAE